MLAVVATGFAIDCGCKQLYELMKKTEGKSCE